MRSPLYMQRILVTKQRRWLNTQRRQIAQKAVYEVEITENSMSLRKRSASCRDRCFISAGNKVHVRLWKLTGWGNDTDSSAIDRTLSTGFAYLALLIDKALASISQRFPIQYHNWGLHQNGFSICASTGEDCRNSTAALVHYLSTMAECNKVQGQDGSLLRQDTGIPFILNWPIATNL